MIHIIFGKYGELKLPSNEVFVFVEEETLTLQFLELPYGDISIHIGPDADGLVMEDGNLTLEL